MGVTLTSPRPSHGSLNWDTALENDLAGLAAAINYPVVITDANAVTQSGYYSLSGGANGPGSGAYLILAIVRDGANIIQQAWALNSTASWARRYQGGSWSPWVSTYSDTGWVTSGAGLSAASGWTLGASKYRNLNGVVSLGATMTRTGAAITANTLGVTAATPILNLGALAPASQANGNFTGGPNGNTPVNAYASASGNNIVVIGTAPNQSITTGAVVELLGTYLL